MYIFHIICFLLLWSKSATSFRSMCLPALWASFKQWRISRYWVSACPTWISFWISGFTSFSVKKICYVFTKISLHAEVLSIRRPRKYHQISVTVNIHVLFIYMFYLVCYKAKDKFHLKCERMSRLDLYTFVRREHVQNIYISNRRWIL